MNRSAKERRCSSERPGRLRANSTETPVSSETAMHGNHSDQEHSTSVGAQGTLHKHTLALNAASNGHSAGLGKGPATNRIAGGLPCITQAQVYYT